jgi:transposase-like protein
MKTNNRKRKQYRAAEKVSIIRRHLIEKQSVADLCDEYGIAPSLYYRWQKQFFEGGEKAFATTRETAVNQLQQEVNQLQAKLTRKNEVLGEVLEEYVTLKKSVGGR